MSDKEASVGDISLTTDPEDMVADTPTSQSYTTKNNKKKIISFSLFTGTPGALPQYLEKGVFANIEGYRFYFPDWICRFYIADVNSMPQQFMERLRASRVRVPVEIVEMDSWGRPSNNMLQRFLPFDDPDVEIFVVRDLDSRPSIRELLAVNEWISSPQGELFHSMKDHPYHIGVNIMGGMFGAKQGALGDTKVADLMEVFRSGRGKKVGDDQAFLSQNIWPLIKDSAIVHDSRECSQISKKGACRPFPFSIGWVDFHIGHPFKNDDETGRAFFFDQYHCFSTCHMAELECTCKAKSYKMHHKKDYVLGPRDWQMQPGPEYPADIKKAVATGTLSNTSMCAWNDKIDEYDCSKFK